MKSGLRSLAASAAVAALVAGAGQAAAQSYPIDNVTLVTHSAAGGGTDVFLREMNKYLAKHMGTSFVVENVRGGSGAKAMAKLATAPAAGSLFYVTPPPFINTSLLRSPDYTYQPPPPLINVFPHPHTPHAPPHPPLPTPPPPSH